MKIGDRIYKDGKRWDITGVCNSRLGDKSPAIVCLRDCDQPDPQNDFRVPIELVEGIALIKKEVLNDV